MPARTSLIARPAAARLLLLAAILLVFGRIVSSDFVDWDDGTLIYDNPNITSGTLSGLARQWNWHDPHTFKLYDPLVYTVWWVLARAGKVQTPDSLGATINPQIFHAANLLVHWLAACVVLEILRHLGIGGWPRFAAALLFAVHPLQAEAVAWAAGMKDLLGGLLSLAAIWRYLIAAECARGFPLPPVLRGRAGEGAPTLALPRSTGRGDKRDGRFEYLIATFLYVLALLAKPSAAAVPLIVLALDVIFYRRPLRRSLLRMTPWLVLSAAAMTITLSLQPAASAAYSPPWSRPLIAGDALAFYLAKLIAPIHLSFEYGRTPQSMLSDPGLYWHWIIPVIAAVIAWRLGRRAITSAAVSFFGLLPVLGFVPFAFQYFSTVADRYMYVPMLGVAMALGFFLMRFGHRVIWCVTAAVLASLMVLSFQQAGRWENTDTLYSYALSLHRTTATHYMIAAEYEEKEADFALRRRNLAMQQSNEASAGDNQQTARQELQKAADYRQRELSYDPTDDEARRQLPIDLHLLNELSPATTHPGR